MKGRGKMSKRSLILVIMLVLMVAFLHPEGTNISPISNIFNGMQVATGGNVSIGLRSDGTVLAVGYPPEACDVGSWTNIVQIAGGGDHTVGLRADGTVIAAGINHSGECNVQDWTDIVQIAASEYITVGLKSDGRVVAAGFNHLGQCNVSDWQDIKQVTCGCFFTVGLKSDGTVIATGDNSNGQCDLDDLTDIVQIDSKGQHTVALKADGTVLEASWGHVSTVPLENIVQVSAGGYPIAGLTADGTVMIAGFDAFEWEQPCSGWNNIVQIDAGGIHILGLRKDGTVVAAGLDLNGYCKVEDWQLNVHKNVMIDIKPGSNINAINLNSRGSIPVAIFSTADFDACEVDPRTVRLNIAGIRVNRNNKYQSNQEDVNCDGFLDLVVHIETSALNFKIGDTKAILEGKTYSGLNIKGEDLVRIIRE
jgi:alpha-tubulin suppressor-like RCC1 family protein